MQQRRGRQLGLFVSAAQVSSNDFKTGMSIEVDGQPYKVVGTYFNVVYGCSTIRFVDDIDMFSMQSSCTSSQEREQPLFAPN